MQKAFFAGEVSNEPELRGQDANVLSFKIACKSRNRKLGEDVIEQFPCVMFGPRAKSISRFLAKGLPVTIEAKPHENVWEKENGKTWSSIQFIVSDIVVGQRAAS